MAASVLHAQSGRRPYSVIGYGGNYLHNYLIPPTPAATPFAPAWAPDGRRVAFSLHGSIWIATLSDGTAREVAGGAKYLSSPTWSPDGQWLVYTADDGGKTIELEALEVATGVTSALSSDGRAILDPVFSPDGSRLAYVASQPNGYLNVFVRGLRDGRWTGEAMPITDDSTTDVPVERPYFTPQDMAITPAWINDRELAIVANHGVPLGSGAILRVPAERLGIRQATVLVNEQTLYHARPAVSPDGRTLAYVSADGGRRPRHALVLREIGAGPPTSSSPPPSSAPSSSTTSSASPQSPSPAPSSSPSSSQGRHIAPGAYDLFQPRWSPDGRRLLCLANERGVPELAMVDVASGAIQRLPTPALTWRAPRGQVAVTVRDATTRAVVAARVHVTAADGKFYAPTGTYARVSWAGDRLFHTDGRFELSLPPGRARLQIVRGFELVPAQVEIDVAADQRRDLDVALERLDDQAARGWYGGSTGAHMQAGGLLLEGLGALVGMAEAEAVPMVSNPVAHQPRDLTAADFWVRGAPAHRASSRATQVVLGQEHRPPFFGHVMAFGMKGRLPSLIPVTIGFEPPPGSSLARTNTDVLRDMRTRGAATSYVHAFSGEQDPMQAGLGIGKAFPVDAALGLTDTLEWAAASRGSFVPWYAALNNGLRVAAIGGEDSITNLHISRLVGCVRTYVYLGKTPLTPTAWWEAANAGRSFVTTGPLVDLRVNGEGPGGTVTLGLGTRARGAPDRGTPDRDTPDRGTPGARTPSPGARGGSHPGLAAPGSGSADGATSGTRTPGEAGAGAGAGRAPAADGRYRVAVTARVRSITPLQRVQLVMNGRPVQDVPLDASRTRVDWQGDVAVDRSGWLHLRAEGLPADRGPLDALYAQAFTNPVWLMVDGKPIRDRAAADYAIQWIDRLQLMADAWPGWTSTEERAHVFGQFEEARAVYRRFAQDAPPADRATSQSGDSR